MYCGNKLIATLSASLYAIIMYRTVKITRKTLCWVLFAALLFQYPADTEGITNMCTHDVDGDEFISSIGLHQMTLIEQ